ncbi:drug/metabolite transporter (DMT)-like permease [Pseudoclavibacter chungangensis]|nr:drug/metabolite transporter (DMT)-like permease [Pseudoclavibacter chungangensis]
MLADPRIGPGVIATIVALPGLAAGSILQARRAADVDPVVFTAIGVTVAAPAAAAVSFLEPQHLSGGAPEFALIALVTAVGTVGTFGYAAVVRRAGARFASMLFAVIPGTAAVIGAILTAAPLGPVQLTALGIGAVACAVEPLRRGAARLLGNTGVRWSGLRGRHEPSTVEPDPDHAGAGRPSR